MLVQIDRIYEEVEKRRAARIELASPELGQVAQHDRARSVLRLDRRNLLFDEIAIAGVEIGIDVVELGARTQIGGAGKDAFGKRLLLDAVRLPLQQRRRP